MTGSSPAGTGIIVGVDGSEASNAAVRWATREAQMRKTDLTIVNATKPVETWARVPMPPGVNAWQEAESRQIVTDAVDVSKAAAGDSEPPHVEYRFFVSAPVPTLVDLSKEAEMIVVGSRGRGAFTRHALGSVSNEVVHFAHCPVAVVRNDGARDLPSGSAPVVVGVDGSATSRTALDLAFEEAASRGADLIAVHAWTDGNVAEFMGPRWSEFTAAVEDELTDLLSSRVERFPGVVVRHDAVLDNPAGRLIELSESAQLVVIGSHGRGAVTKMLLGSVSTAVVHGAHCPVLVARNR